MAKSNPRAIYDGLTPEERIEISECWPRGIGMNVRFVDRFVALDLCMVIGTRGPFARDVEWTKLGAAVGQIVGPPKDDDGD
jgi:hypothetical protein